MQKTKVRQPSTAVAPPADEAARGVDRVAAVRDLLFRGGLILLAVLWI